MSNLQPIHESSITTFLQLIALPLHQMSFVAFFLALLRIAMNSSFNVEIIQFVVVFLLLYVCIL